MRRTFLFFVGLAIAKLLKEYFSVAQNRASFWSLLRSLKQTLEQKYISWGLVNNAPQANSNQVSYQDETKARRSLIAFFFRKIRQLSFFAY